MTFQLAAVAETTDTKAASQYLSLYYVHAPLMKVHIHWACCAVSHSLSRERVHKPEKAAH